MSEYKKFDELYHTELDKLNMYQHEITDTHGKDVILVAFDKDCGKGCNC